MCKKWMLVVSTESGLSETIKDIPATPEDIGTVYRGVNNVVMQNNDSINSAKVWSQPDPNDAGFESQFQYTII